MGMYTEIHYNVSLIEDVPKDVIKVLKYMLDNDELLPEPMIIHPLFDTERWHYMFRCTSYYFMFPNHSHSILYFDEIHNGWYLNIKSDFKNYFSEIEHFIDWLDPYVDAYPGDFLGFHRYEETEDPTIIRKK